MDEKRAASHLLDLCSVRDIMLLKALWSRGVLDKIK